MGKNIVARDDIFQYLPGRQKNLKGGIDFPENGKNGWDD